MFRRKWEVYRVIPQGWNWPENTGSPFSRHRTEKRAKRMAADCDWTMRNGRSDEDFAAFKVRKVG